MSGTDEDQFYTLANAYVDFFATPFRQYLEVPSVLSAVRGVADTAVFDLGCGAGDYSRLLKEHGASIAVGYDISGGMIAYAKERESREPCGIDYYSGDFPIELDQSFDVVLSVYVMPYATTYQELADQCSTAARLLRPGGRYVTLPIHPDFIWNQPDYYAPYGFRLWSDTTPIDASPLTFQLIFADYNETLTARFWSRETLALALGESGFSDVQWKTHHVTGGGIEAEGADHWAPYLRQPHAAIITARKPGP